MISLKNISYEVSDRVLFKNLNKNLQQDRYALIGPNGVGKSTLAKIIAGIIQPQTGTLQSDVKVSYFSQSEERAKEKVHQYLAPVWENFGEHSTLIMELVQNIDENLNVESLSGGEWIKLRLAKVLAESPQFLILDEPTNNLDSEGKKTIHDLLEKFHGGILLISHDRELLEKVNEILELSNQGLEIYGGNFSDYRVISEKERSDAEENLNLKKREEKKKRQERTEKIERQEKRIRAGNAVAEKGGLPRILVGGLKRQAQKTLNKINLSESNRIHEASLETRAAWKQMKIDPFIRFDFEAHKPPNNRIHFAVENLNYRFQGQEKNLWPENLNFYLRGCDRLWIHGLNGSGKTTLLSLLLQRNVLEIGKACGSVKQSPSKIGYLDQGYGLLDPNKTLLENLLGDSRFSEEELRNELSFFGFTGAAAYQLVSSFSGGETLKASLAKALLGSHIPEILILDEPTNNLDIKSQDLLIKALQEFKGALLIVSHDRAFIKAIKPNQEILLQKNR